MFYIKAYIFDFDGTLANTLPICFEAFQAVFHKFDGKYVTPDEIKAMFGPSETGIIKQNLRSIKQKEAIEFYYKIYEEKHAQFVQSNEEIMNVLHRLKKKGMKLGIVTGKGKRSLNLSLDALQMTTLFDVIITGDDVLHPKPHPEGVIKALTLLGVQESDAVFIGDSDADIEAGNRANVHTVGVHWLPEYHSEKFTCKPNSYFANVSDFITSLEEKTSYKWLEWAKRIQALSQSGLAFSKDAFDIERYEELRNISAEIMAEHTGIKMEKIKTLFAKEQGYHTPKVDVRGVVWMEDKILMVKEKIDNKWALPGGFCDIEHSPSENIVKEIKEESGFDVVPTKLLAILDMNKHPHPPQPYHYYKIFIECEIIGGFAEIGIETNDIRFFSEEQLPELSTGRNTASQIKMAFQFLKDRKKEAIFD
ncbi:NUDIX hydrolase N-terminal domain-containing protein [Alkalihalobacillus sp. LMS39]|uniref:NUDIX hydrolase N-terminal domain-containing protein n=1 Tax=Alkalihalobacillus sp. LMS39 TaxID=2924032 RepID=UPI003261A93D